MTIRLATEADLPELLRLGEAFYGWVYGHVGRPFDEARAAQTWRSLVGQDAVEGLRGVTYVAEGPDATILGMIAGIAHPDLFSQGVVVSELFWYVIPEARRGLAGGRLMAALIAWASRAGASVIRWVAPTAEIAAVYERRGFDVVETHYQQRLSA